MVDIFKRAVSRRLFLTGSAAGLAVVGLTACGGAEGGGTGGSTGASGSGDFPLTLTGAEGRTVLEAAPERVISVGFMRDVDEAVSLGVVPIAVTPAINFDSGLAPWVEAKLSGATAPEQLDYEDALPFEKIIELDPDLILATDSYSLTDDWADLSAIAPTLSYTKDVAEDTWQERAKLIGAALGKADLAERTVADVAAKVAAAKAEHEKVLSGKTFSFSLLNGEGQLATVIAATDTSAQFISQLGMTLSDSVTGLPQSGPPGRAVVAQENTHLLDADVVLFSYRDDEERARVEGDRLFSGLSAVQRGAYVPLPVGEALSMAFPSTLSIPFAIDKVVPRLVAAAAKA